jgi:hypothetical protein
VLPATLVGKNNYWPARSPTMTTPPDFHTNRSKYAYLAATYDITPIRQFKLLPNRPEPGLHRQLTDHAYQFIAAKKGGGTPFFFNTGSSSGKQLLQAAGKTMPPLESCESVLGVPGPRLGPAVPSAPPGAPVKGAMCAFNAALLQLLNLFFLKHALDPTKPSGNLYTLINQNPGAPQYKAAHALNTILIRFNETSAALVNWLKAQVSAAKVRAFDFTILSNYLNTLQSPPPVVAI